MSYGVVSLEVILVISLLAVLEVGLMVLLAMGLIDIGSFKELELAVIGIIGGILSGIGIGIKIALAERK